MAEWTTGKICATMAFLALLLVPLGVCDQARAETSGTLRLENKAVVLELETAHGRILRLQDKQSGTELVSPTEQAQNFRLLVPVEGKRNNVIHGRDQLVTNLTHTDNSARLEWKGPLTDERGAAHKIGAVMTMTLEGAGLRVEFHLDNASDQVVEEAWYPLLGDALNFDGAGTDAKVTLMPPPHNGKAFARPFGEYAVGYPGGMSFVDLSATAHKRGLYFGAHDPLARYKHFRFIEIGSGNTSQVFFSLCHFPLTKPGQTFDGAPVVLQFHDGDWIAAGKTLYRPWFLSAFGLKPPKDDWIRQQGFFQMIMIMLPEGNVNYRFSEIPQIARDGLKYGVKSLQIAGWQRGGHDNGYPYYEPDPRLGTWDELRDAIAACHKMGVKIYFFSNITVVNLDTEINKTILKDCSWSSESGADYWIAGWGMGTLASRMSLTAPLMGFYDTSFPAMHDIQLGYYKKLAEVGADGLHFDKTFPGNMNFNPLAPMAPDTCLYEGAIRLIRDTHDQCNAIHPGFCLSFESNWDRVLQYGVGTWWAGNMSTAREIFPELVETVGLYQPYDYMGVNEAVRAGHTIMLSPHHFNRSMAYPTWRGLARYIADVKKIRDQLSDIVFLGERIPASAGMALKPEAMGPGVAAQNYRSRTNGQLGCIITNNGSAPAALTLPAFAGAESGHGRLYVPGARPRRVALPCTITIPAERLIMVVAE